MFTNTLGTQNALLQQQQQQGLAGQSSLVFGNNAVSNTIFGQTQQLNAPIGQIQNQGIHGQQLNQLGQPQIYGGQIQQTTNLTQQPLGQQMGFLGQQTAQLGQTQQTGFLGQQPNLQGGQIQQMQQQSLLQSQQPQQQQQSSQQQQQTKQYTIQQIKNETQKHIDNLTKTILNKEKIEKNQKNLQLIEKNSLRNIQQQQQQQPQVNQSIGYGIVQQQVIKPIQKADPRNHTAKVEKYYSEWNKGIQRIVQKQGETINQLNELNSLLSQQDTFYEIDEESLIDSIKQLGKELNQLEQKIIDIAKLQENILGLEKEESEWDQIVNNLSECLTLLDIQTKEVEDQLNQAETHPKVVNK
ncbi:unnamed protein product [Paramecium sonneborni]|uniref:Uncharacterized protein n=1 Tax=Paramecium sonneborni TaxID=65129 RepID=A0A8S1MQ36_9CILI|nr:unnamed protein product [Paramecium sonneborni]